MLRKENSSLNQEIGQEITLPSEVSAGDTGTQGDGLPGEESAQGGVGAR